MKLLTGNDLASGVVLWWTGSGWSQRLGDAVDVGDAGAAIAATEEAARRINGPYLLTATATPDGPRPTSLKDRIRATGPSSRLPEAARAA